MLLITKLIVLALVLNNATVSAEEKPIIIGISQIAEHPALDEEREGIIEYLAEYGYKDGEKIKIVYQNAQGNLGTANQIAQKLISADPKVIVAISTPAAQSVTPLAQKYQIPLVFTAVTDPYAAKILQKKGKPNRYITGISDRLPILPQLELIRQLYPKAKKLGILYNSGEINSCAAVEDLKKLAPAHDFEIIESTASKTADMAMSTDKLVALADVIIVLNDNTAVSAIETIVKHAHDHNIPVFAGDSGSISKGALAGYVYDRKILGRQAGEIVLKIIKNELENDKSVSDNHPLTLMVNKDSAKLLKTNLPADLIHTAKMVETK